MFQMPGYSLLLLLLSLLLIQATALKAGRVLSQEPILSYEPETVVTSQAAIDLDQELMAKLLATGTKQGREQALLVYMLGAHSGAYAELRLKEPLEFGIPKDTSVEGKTTTGRELLGRVKQEAEEGDTLLRVEYRFSPVQAEYVGCQVGGNPDPVTEGCFAESGQIEVGFDYGSFPYSYNVTEENFNGRTLQTLSTEAKKKMYECSEGCPYRTYQKYYDYFGTFDYANQWVYAAYNNAATNFSHGNVNFASFDDHATGEAMKMATAYMSVWQYVIKEMETAIYHCASGCDPQEENCREKQVHEWDKAVAMFTGSIPRVEGLGGNLMYTLGQQLCRKFGTCLNKGMNVGMASINDKIFRFFKAGKQNILTGNCQDAHVNANNITQFMSVPLIQATLNAAYVLNKGTGSSDVTKAIGATMAASVLPLVHSCSDADATVIYNNMRADRGEPPDFASVKAAFERNYNCMKITCDHVGGLVNAGSNGYLEGAQPCGVKIDTTTATNSNTIHGTITTNSGNSGVAPTSTAKDDGPNVGLAVGLTLAVVAGLIIVAAIISRKGDKEYDSNTRGIAEYA